MDRQELERLLMEGLSLEEIGRRLDRHPSTIGYWLKKHGLAAAHRERHAPRGGIAKEVLAALVARGLSVRQLAAEVQFSPSAVRYWLEVYGLSTHDVVRGRSLTSETSLPRRVTRACRKHGRTDFVLEGRGYYRCAKCRQDRVARWRRQTKLKLVAEFGGRCAICGYDRFPGALEFHHLDPAMKKFGLSARGRTRGMSQLREEASKCVLLCSNCHAEVEGGLTRYPDCVTGPGWPTGKAADC